LSHGTITDPAPRQFKKTAPTPQPQPEVPPVVTPPAAGTLLYDSNVDIDWTKGDQKIEDILGDDSKPNSKYIRMNASGSPRMYLVAATKELILEHDGKYGRAYFGVCNYNSRLECEFKLDSCSNNASFKVRNRHQYADTVDANAPNEQKQGGQGCAVHCDSVENDLEVYHGKEMGGPSASLSPKLAAGQYHKLEFSCFDKGGKIHVIDKINGKVVSEGDIAAPSQFFNKAEFDAWSEFWVRLNADSGGKLYIKNLKMYAL